MTTPVVAPRSGLNPPHATAPRSHSPLDTGAIPKKQHRHSGIFRVANFRPGTMPRGKYPESPAPAGSHALISRTPTPGGMLHANLGLPRPPPRNFQPPLPRFLSRLSPRRMSETTLGRILSHAPELRLRCREATAREGRRWRSSGGILSHPLRRPRASSELNPPNPPTPSSRPLPQTSQSGARRAI